jgi:hypothetical protein
VSTTVLLFSRDQEQAATVYVRCSEPTITASIELKSATSPGATM